MTMPLPTMPSAQAIPIISAAAQAAISQGAPFPGSMAEKVPAQTAKDIIPWVVVGIGVVAGVASMWYYYKKMR